MIQPAWTPEREITLEQAVRLVGSVFPDLSGSEAELFAEGWDNTAVRFRTTRLGELIFRFPRRAVALPGVRRELAWLPRLAPLLPLPIPVPEFASWSDQGVDGWPFWGARMLPGVELAQSPPRERVVIAGQLGAFLRVLHRLPPRDFGIGDDAALASDPLGRGHPARRAAKTAECLARLRSRGDREASVPFEALAELLDRAARLPAPEPPGVICHGDLHVRHVLISASAITGVIDWGDLCLADPAVDLSIAFSAFSGEAREAFFTAYGPIDAERELRARALAVSLSSLLTEYALAQVSPDGERSPLLPEVCHGLTRALEI